MSTTTLPDLADPVRSLIESGKARELRTRAGLTLADAAQACGDVHPASILRWEQGRVPRGRNLAAYSRFLLQLAGREAVS